MMIAVTADRPRMDALVDPHFARCAFVVLTDTTSGAVEFLPNPSANRGEGRCADLTRFLADRGVECVLMRHCGDHARRRLAETGIRAIEGFDGTVNEVLRRFARETKPA